MRFLIDAQLPRRLSLSLAAKGFVAIHSSELPAGNRTPDSELSRLALEDQLILVTKDSDFVYSHVVLEQPPKLLFVSTGNISNSELIEIVEANIEQIKTGFEVGDWLEITRTILITH